MLRERVLHGARNRLSKADWEDLGSAVLSTRADLLRPRIDLGMRWYLATLPPDPLPRVRVMKLRIFAPLAPERTLDEFVTSLDRGAVPRVWSRSNYRRLRSTFEPSRMHGLPILVAVRPSGPYVILEGTTRLSVVLSQQRAGELPRAAIPVVLGVGRLLRRWEFY